MSGRRSWRRFVVVLMAAVLVIGLVGLAGCKAKVTEIKIGGISPLTGPCGRPGEIMKQAAEMAVEEINAAGQGPRINLLWEDDEGTPAKSVSVAEKLVVQDQVLVVVGPYNSSCCLAHMAVTQREKTPQVDPVAFATAITRSGNEYMFRNIPVLSTVATKFTNYVVDHGTGLGVESYAIIYENSDYGLDFITYIEGAMAAKNAPIVAKESFNLGDTDMYAQLTKIKAKKPDCLILVCQITEGAQILRQVKELNLGLKLTIETGSMSGQESWDLAGQAMEGVITFSFFEAATTNPKALAFVQNFKAKYGIEPDMFAAATYDAIYIIQDAVARAETDSDLAVWRENVRDALAATTDVEGVQGRVDFNEYGESDCTIYVVEWTGGTKNIMAELAP